MYGVFCYAVSLATFAYLAAFVGNIGIKRSLDAPAQSPFWMALLINFALVALFGVQHTLMARPAFKSAWTRIVPASVERSTYLLFTCVALGVMFRFWRPMGGVIWHVASPGTQTALLALYVCGWLLVLAVTFLINHFDLFGLRQVTLRLLGRPYTEIGFRTPGPYKFVRHPLYIGWLIVFWAAPVMTAAHLVFAVGLTIYILTAIQFEERDLARFHPEYEEYRRRVPMIVPAGSAKWSTPTTGRSVAREAS